MQVIYVSNIRKSILMGGNVMLGKKYFLIPVIILILSVVFITGLAATTTTCQIWYLNSITHSTEPHEIMQKAEISTSMVSIGSGQSNLWITDEAAIHDVTFCGNWVIEVERYPSLPNWTDYCTALVGTWDPDSDVFTPFSINGFTRVNPSSNPDIIRIVLKSGSNAVPEGSYLALEVTNNDSSGSHDVRTDGVSKMLSCSNPGYPMPEIATGVLFFGGLIGLGAYIGIRRRKTAA
jgi:hypothetical protein